MHNDWGVNFTCPRIGKPKIFIRVCTINSIKKLGFFRILWQKGLEKFCLEKSRGCLVDSENCKKGCPSLSLSLLKCTYMWSKYIMNREIYIWRCGHINKVESLLSLYLRFVPLSVSFIVVFGHFVTEH